MITLDQLFGFAVVAAVLIAIPGPSVVFTVGRALAYGRRVALATVVGNTLGLLTIVVLVSLGLGIVVQESILAFTVLKLAGAAYLVWLGVQAVRHRREYLGEPAGDGDEPEIRDPRRAMGLRTSARQGYVVGVSNPKAFLIIGAVLPQFVNRAEGHAQGQMLLLGLVAVTIGLCSDALWAVVASQLRTWFLASRRRGEVLGTVGGLSMVGLGVSLAVTGRTE
jgi:threonine/homoserine/homoserine lactone efflux protein